MIRLGQFVDEHHEALNTDLITSAGVELKDVGRTLSWGAFYSFVKNLNCDSALWRSIHPEMSDWGTTLRTNIILADIYDALMTINSNMVGGFSRHKAKRTKPYPRPWRKSNESRKFGKGALPKNELREWIKNYRKKGR